MEFKQENAKRTQMNALFWPYQHVIVLIRLDKCVNILGSSDIPALLWSRCK